jgi:hypothetical protein
MNNDMLNNGTEEFPEEQLALAQHLECKPDDLIKQHGTHYGLVSYYSDIIGQEYAIGDEETAQKAFEEYLPLRFWCIEPYYICYACGLPDSFVRILQLAQKTFGEWCNEDLASLISICNGIWRLKTCSIIRGQVLAMYDGVERKFQYRDITFYAYRLH